MMATSSLYDYVMVEVDKRIAAALHPLLQPAPAPADMQSVAERIATLERDLDDACKERDWFMARLHEAMQAQPTPARLLAVDAAKQRAELALADAQQANAQLTAALAALEPKFIAAVAGEVAHYGNHTTRIGIEQALHKATTERDELAAQLDAMTQQRDEARRERDMAQRIATRFSDKWATIPWEPLDYLVDPSSSVYGERWQLAIGWLRKWLDANRPTEQAQD